MELKDIQDVDPSTKFGRDEMFRLGSCLLFIVMIILYVPTINILDRPLSIELIVTAIIGGYMAMNVGANNVGPAAGSNALTRAGAIIIAGLTVAKLVSIVKALLAQFKSVSAQEKSKMLRTLKRTAVHPQLSNTEPKALKLSICSELVKRSTLPKIRAAWVITVPASAIMTGLIFFPICGMMLT